MLAGLGHIDLMPFIYGVIMFIGLWSMWHKLTHANIYGFILEVSVFTVVFLLHGGTVTGGFSAMVAALLFGTFFGRKRRKS